MEGKRERKKKRGRKREGRKERGKNSKSGEKSKGRYGGEGTESPEGMRALLLKKGRGKGGKKEKGGKKRKKKICRTNVKLHLYFLRPCLASTRGILRGDYCTFDYFTEYFMLSGNGSVIEVSRFIRMTKYHTRIVRTHYLKIAYVRRITWITYAKENGEGMSPSSSD